MLHASGVVLLACLCSVACGIRTAPFRDSDGRPVRGSVAVMEDHAIGGVKQRIWFRGVNTAAPAVILLHGGPGASEAALFRHFNGALDQHFLMGAARHRTFLSQRRHTAVDDHGTVRARSR